MQFSGVRYNGKLNAVHFREIKHIDALNLPLTPSSVLSGRHFKIDFADCCFSIILHYFVFYTCVVLCGEQLSVLNAAY